MNQAPNIPGVTGLQEFGRSTLVVGYKGEAGGVATIVEVLLADDEENRREFNRSSALQSRIAHPGVPPIQKSGLTEGRPYRVREFVEGRPASVLFTDGQLSEERLLTTGQALASTLEALHRRGIVHTEVHPHGLRVESSGLVRFIDIGRAWPLNRPLPKLERHLAEPYAAPEYKEGQSPRTESDVYSLAAVLVSLAVGRPAPASGVNFEMIKERKEPLCPAFRVLLRAMLDKDPSKRPEAQTVSDSLLRIEQLNAHLRLKSWKPPVSSTTFLGNHAYPLVGRATELRTLMGLWQRAAKGHGMSVTILGPTGSGCRRLVEELRRGVQRTGGMVVRHRLEADASQPTLIVNLAHKGQQGNEPDKPWLSVNFATSGPVADQHVIELGPLGQDDCVRLAESYLVSPPSRELQNYFYNKGGSLPGELLAKLDQWCEEGVLKPAQGNWRFEPYDAIPEPATVRNKEAKEVKGGVSYDAPIVQQNLMELWPTNLEQDDPVLASLKSFNAVLNAKRVDLYKLVSGEPEHVTGTVLGETELDSDLLEKLLLRTEPAWNKTSLLIPLRCGVIPSGILSLVWEAHQRPEFDPALLQVLTACASPFALWLGIDKP